MLDFLWLWSLFSFPTLFTKATFFSPISEDKKQGTYLKHVYMEMEDPR